MRPPQQEPQWTKKTALTTQTELRGRDAFSQSHKNWELMLVSGRQEAFWDSMVSWVRQAEGRCVLLPEWCRTAGGRLADVIPFSAELIRGFGGFVWWMSSVCLTHSKSPWWASLCCCSLDYHKSKILRFIRCEQTAIHNVDSKTQLFMAAAF